MTSTGPQLEKRCTRADREAVADLLSQHYTAGSLDEAEFGERLDKAMAAKFPSELTGLCLDLPDLCPVDEPVPVKRVKPVRQPVEPRPQAVEHDQLPYGPRTRLAPWAVQNWLAMCGSIVFMLIVGALFHGSGDGGAAYLVMLLGCGLVNAALGYRKAQLLAFIGFLTGPLTFVGTAIMIALTWRTKVRQP
jgi:hypothetical protein